MVVGVSKPNLGPKDHTNIKKGSHILVPKPKTRGVPKIRLSRILVHMPCATYHRPQILYHILYTFCLIRILLFIVVLSGPRASVPKVS